MHSFEILPHTADLRLKISGDSPEELFRAAVIGMGSVIKRDACDAGKINKKKNVSLRSADRTALLVDFLSEVLTASQTDKIVFCDASFEKLTETELIGEIKGTTVDEFDEDIKAVTYHEADVQKNERGQWETVIIFDI